MSNQSHQFVNPFLNHLVIQNILKHIDRISEIKRLRLLCTQWNVFAGPKLLNESIVNINSERTMEHYIKYFSQERTPAPHKNFHIKILKSLESKTIEEFLNYILTTSAEELHISKCVMRPQEILKLLSLGKNLKTLSFNEVLIEDDIDSRADKDNDDVEQVTEFPSNLIRLEVTTCEECNPFPWAMIFAKLPKLEILHAQMQDYTQVNSLLESMIENPIQLKEFSSFLIDFESEHISMLQCLEWPLISIDLSISSSVETKAIENLLGSPGFRKIETIKLFHETETELNEILLPSLPAVRSLELMGDPVGPSILSSIRSGCPNLKHLNLSQMLAGTNGTQITGMKFVHKNLQSVSIEEGYLSKDELIKIAQLFPSLRRVCLFLNDDNIGALFKSYENLEEIIVLGTQLTDLGIIGINQSTRSFLGDCKKLKKFSLYPQPQDRITDMSIHHGLIHVPQIISIELPETCVTNEGLRTLIKAKPNLSRLSARIAIDPRTGEHSLRSTKYQIVE